MNDGLNQKTVKVDDEPIWTERWWRDTKRQINHGYAKFCETHNVEPEPTMRQIIKAEHAAAVKQRQK